MIALGSLATTSTWAASSGDVNAGSIAAVEQRSGGRLGVFAIDLATGRTLAYRADERFRLQSSFKALLAAMVLVEVTKGRLRLDEVISYALRDLIDASPVTKVNASAGTMRISDLCAAIMTYSDNTAANLLLRRVGGPQALTAFLRSMGDTTTELDHNEPLQDNVPYPSDSTTPRAIARTVGQLLTGPTLRAAERQQWEAWMASNTVGRRRLRAAFPPQWSAGDRTGTADGICNDVAFARRHGRAPLIVAAYHDAPGLELSAQEAALRHVGRLIVSWQNAAT